MKKPESNPDRLAIASECMKKVAISLTLRRPKGFSAWQTDAAMQEALAIEARIGALSKRFQPQESR